MWEIREVGGSSAYSFVLVLRKYECREGAAEVGLDLVYLIKEGLVLLLPVNLIQTQWGGLYPSRCRRKRAGETDLHLSLLRRVGEGESDVVRCALCFSYQGTQNY